jgi:hypothetical protein
LRSAVHGSAVVVILFARSLDAGSSEVDPSLEVALRSR